MLNDGDIDQQRRIHAAVGAIVAAVYNDTAAGLLAAMGLSENEIS
jgi:hypothetical protein